MELVFDILLDALKDTAYLIPFLYVTYVFMEWLEIKTSDATYTTVSAAGRFGPAIGALLGLLPQCGFSAAAATLYAGRVISRGTLIAVFLATSDEMLPIFIAKAVPIEQILALLGAKFAIGMVAGFLIDIILHFTHKNSTEFKIHELCEQEECNCEECCCGCEGDWKSILIYALIHTIQVTIFVFIINLILGFFIAFIGEDALGDFLKANDNIAIVLSAIVGLIPNCAASVAIADLWTEGLLGTGAMLSGLLVSAGIGLIVLFRTNMEPKRNFSIVATLLVIGIACGFVTSLFIA
ncbi:MAG: putative manganese transporter [Phoenicibacter congonensis]|uniref:Manganese transporter n=1 Tax=Phoenicibacter congonensis TaxID=1944646 RepID=A0AA43RJQ3_9ACTN|nr:putative manganese transporter [Phoenicibacter congonensis]